jgi:hypothetical protein
VDEMDGGRGMDRHAGPNRPDRLNRLPRPVQSNVHVGPGGPVWWYWTAWTAYVIGALGG